MSKTETVTIKEILGWDGDDFLFIDESGNTVRLVGAVLTGMKRGFEEEEK